MITPMRLIALWVVLGVACARPSSCSPGDVRCANSGSESRATYGCTDANNHVREVRADDPCLNTYGGTPSGSGDGETHRCPWGPSGTIEVPATLACRDLVGNGR